MDVLGRARLDGEGHVPHRASDEERLQERCFCFVHSAPEKQKNGPAERQSEADPCEMALVPLLAVGRDPRLGVATDPARRRGKVLRGHLSRRSTVSSPLVERGRPLLGCSSGIPAGH